MSKGAPMMPMSKGMSGSTRHFTWGRWAKVDMPEYDHWVPLLVSEQCYVLFLQQTGPWGRTSNFHKCSSSAFLLVAAGDLFSLVSCWRSGLSASCSLLAVLLWSGRLEPPLRTAIMPPAMNSERGMTVKKRNSFISQRRRWGFSAVNAMPKVSSEAAGSTRDSEVQIMNSNTRNGISLWTQRWTLQRGRALKMIPRMGTSRNPQLSLSIWCPSR